MNPIEEFSKIYDYVGIAYNSKNKIEYIISIDIDKLNIIKEFIKSLSRETYSFDIVKKLIRIDRKKISIEDYNNYSKIILFETERNQKMNVESYPQKFQEEIKKINIDIKQRIKDRFGPVQWFVPYWYGFSPEYLDQVLEWLIELEKSERVTKEELNELIKKWRIRADFKEKKEEIVNQKKIKEENITIKFTNTSSIDMDMDSHMTFSQILMENPEPVRNTQKINIEQDEEETETRVTVEPEETSESESKNETSNNDEYDSSYFS